MIEITAPDAAPVRLDILLARHLPGIGRRRARALVLEGAVRLNGRRARKGELVQPNDRVCVHRSSLLDSGQLPPQASLPVTILHADETIVAIDKPAGMPAHALQAGELGTAANFLVARYPELGSVGKNPLEAGLVQRLDTGTSGVLLAARSLDSYRHLRRMFASRQVEKLYLAIVIGDMTTRGHINTPIAHAPHNRRRMCVCADAVRARALKARPALTVYRPLRRYAGATLLSVRIRTGVRHQIRVHLASIGHPLLGDDLYSSGAADPIPVSRPLLHAARVRIRQPDNAHAVVIDAPLPEDFREALRGLESVADQEH